MLLFYSNHCTSSQMLVDSIRRYNAISHFKLVNIENLKIKGLPIPSKVHSVPALMFLDDSKTLIFGKQVFDFLLLPNKGFLFNLPKKQSSGGAKEEPSDDLVPYHFNQNALGDSFSFIEENEVIDKHKQYKWSNIDSDTSIPTTTTGLNAETRSKKGLPDLGTLQSERDLELQKYLNTSQ